MPIVSKAARSEYLRQNHPVLFKLCIANTVPKILAFRCNTDLPFSYGRSDAGSPVPASWDTGQVEIIPLWENGSGLIAARVGPDKEEFVQIDYEDPEGAHVIANTVNGLLTYVLYFVVESADRNNIEDFADIEKLAQYLDYGKLDLVMDLIQRFSGDSDYASFCELVRSI